MKYIFIALLLATFSFTVYIFVKPTSSTTVPTSSSSASTTAYTLADVSTHKNQSSCWMAIDSKVYDVTSYINQHPNTRILAGCGIDATAMYNSVRKHIPQGTMLLPQYQIGILN